MANDTSNSNQAANSQNSLFHRLRQTIALFTLEPVIFLLAIASILIELYIGSLTVYKICRVNFEHSVETCKNLTSHPHLEAEVQKVASNYALYFSLVESIPSLVFVTFVGPWSDRHGRKLLIVMPLTTYALSALIPLALAEFEELPPYLLLLKPVITCLSGGFATITVAFFGYISDTTDETTRTMKMGFMNGAWYLGSPIGSFLAGLLLNKCGYACVFCMGILILFTCLFYTIFMVKDPPRPSSVINATNEHSKYVLKEIFNTQNFKDSFRTFFKKRPEHKRQHLWLLAACKCGMLLSVMGTSSIYYLFTRLMFEWSDTTFSYNVMSSSLIYFFSSVVLLPFLIKHAKIEDVYLFIMGVTGNLIVDIITAFSTSGWMLFIAPLVMVHVFTFSPLGSLLIDCIEKDEAGKLSAMLSLVECGIPVLSGALYSQIYNATHDEFPGAVFLVSCGIYILILSIAAWIAYDMWKIKKRTTEREVRDQIKDLDKICKAFQQENKTVCDHMILMRVRSSISQ